LGSRDTAVDSTREFPVKWKTQINRRRFVCRQRLDRKTSRPGLIFY